jgi:hypothetical protein
MLVDTENLALIGQTPASSLGKRRSIDNKEHSVRYLGFSGDGPAAQFSAAVDALQTSINIEALDLTMPLARQRGMGVIAKRPIANALWRSHHRPE